MDESIITLTGKLEFCGRSHTIIDLPAFFGVDLARLPIVLRILLENVARNAGGQDRDRSISALRRWIDTGTSEAELPFQPMRVLMHDTTSTPALVDIAAMRNVLAEHGVDPARLNPTIPVDVSVDHSLAVEAYGRTDAVSRNLQHEMRRNEERYRFLRWASGTLRGVRIHPPGTGIMHTINLEQLATVVTIEERAGNDVKERWAVPDSLIGTDSHTPMINGIGVLGWGVGGLEAQTVMFGMPTMLRIPDVVGVRLVGALGAGCSATDLALTVTQRLRALGVAGDFVEFFGPGVSTLSAGDRAVVANMAPEYGATTGYFGIDEQTLAYLRATGRDEDAIALVEAYSRRVGLWFDPAAEPRYTRTLDIDLSTIGLHVAGPKRPQDLLPLSDAPAALRAHLAATATGTSTLPRFPVAIASITSCTNTSDPRLLVTAGLLARKARAFGLKPADWVKTSLAPGSPAAASYLKRSGLLDDLEAIGFGIVGFGCATCIGNSGPLTDPMRKMIDEGSGQPVAALSGNRNFPGRVHPDLDLGFIMSPALVIAFGLAGDAERNLAIDPVGTSREGKDIYLRDLWPATEDIDRTLAAGQLPEDYRRDFAAAAQNPVWHGLDAPSSPLFPWNERSNYLQRPPFASLDAGSLLGNYTAYPLMVLGDDITTDHISPASAIPPDSLVADYLVGRGDDRKDLNVFASRRGNWQVMLRAAFHNRNVVNLLEPKLPVAHTLHLPSGEAMPIWEAAQRYREQGEAVVIVAGERYGTGSSRDWAAKGVRLLDVRSVLALSFERIHRSNLIGMGILPVQLPPAWRALAPIDAGDRITVMADAGLIAPRCTIDVRIDRADGSIDTIAAKAAIETQLEVDLLKAGGVIPLILEKTVHASREEQSP